MKRKAISALVTLVLAALALVGSAQAAALRSVTIGPQSPATADPGGMVYFQVSVSRAGGGSLSTYMTISGLPPNATSLFDPPELAFDPQSPSTKNAVLIVRLDPLTPAGTYVITVSARHGNSPEVVTVTSTLVVSGTPIILQPPVLNPPVVQADGTLRLSGVGNASQPLLVQATTNLASATSWETISVQTLDARGLFSLVDLDWTNFPARFYRLSQ